MRKLSFLLPILILGCSGEKPEPTVPDYGPEIVGLDGKDDSAHAPASIVDLRIGDVQTASFTARSQFRAFRFDGKKGQKVTLYVDGLKGLDTVAYLYKVSASTHKPYGSALIFNDDTKQGGWTVKTNTKHNPYSSSVEDFALPETRSYALVATTYDGSTGSAEVVVKSTPAGCSSNSECGAKEYCAVATCGGSGGTCTVRPEVCIELYKPVCGCDGKTYSNSCFAQGGGTGVASAGPCALSQEQIDDAARGHAFGSAAGQTIYASEALAQTHSGNWLARDGADSLNAAHFVDGINDLWAERFDVDKSTGAITTTGEH